MTVVVLNAFSWVNLSAFFACMAWMSVIDARKRIISNKLLLVMLVLALMAVGVSTFSNSQAPYVLVWAVALVAVLYAIECARRKFSHKLGLGAGDIKLVGVICVMFGPTLALGALGVGLLLGAIAAVVRHKKTFALGPWISIATFALFIAPYLLR